MRQGRIVLLSVLLLAGAAACQKAEKSVTPTPDQASIQAASTLFSQPSPTPRITQTPTPVNAVQAQPAPRVVNVYIAGEGTPSQAWIRDHLVPGLNEALGDGVQLHVRAA